MTSLIPKAPADVELQISAAIAVAATSFTLTSATDDDGVALAAGLYCFTIDNGKSNKEYLMGSLSGTTVSSVVSVSRQGVSSSGAAFAHRVGAPVIITNFASIQRSEAALNGAIALDSANPLYYDGNPTISADADIATKKYVDDVAIAGAADASVTVKGVVEEATEAEINADTAAGGTSARLFINPSTLRTSEYGVQLPSSDEKAALAGSSGAPASGNKYITEADVSAGAGTDKVVRATGTALPALSAANLTNIPGLLVVNGPYADVTVANTTSETTLLTETIGAGTLNANGKIKVRLYITDFDLTSGAHLCTLRAKLGSTTLASISIGNGGSISTATPLSNRSGWMDVEISNTGSTSAQFGGLTVGFSESATTSHTIIASGTASEDTTGALAFAITAQWNNAETTNSITSKGGNTEVMPS